MKRTMSIFLLSMFVMVLTGCLPADVTTTTATATDTTAITTATSIDTTATTTTIVTTEEVAVGELYDVADLEADFNQLVTYVGLNPQLFTDEAGLDALIETQRAKLTGNMHLLDFYRIVMPIVAAIRCVHSGIQMPQAFYTQYFPSDFNFPVSVRLFGDELLVVRVPGASELSVGDRILTIDGAPVEELLTAMMGFLSADGENLTMKWTTLQSYFLFYYQLFIHYDNDIEIGFYDAEQEINRTITLTKCDYTDSYDYEDTPYSSAFYENYAVLRVTEFQPYGSNTLDSFYTFFNTFFTQVETAGIEHIILDVRENWGGDPRVTSRLFSYLAKTSQPYFAASVPEYYTGLKSNVPLSQPHFDGHVYTLINGHCSSSCGHFVALMKYQDVGVFIGDESGGSYTCSDSSTEFTLSHTRLVFRTSMAVWTVATTGLVTGRGIMPDYPIQQSLADYLSETDTVMQYAISLIEADLLGE